MENSMEPGILQAVRDSLQIRYVKLHFTVVFPQACRLPASKVSALRGGMGQMLLMTNCISDGQCEKCEFESECIVRRTMYSKMEIRPKFMTGGDSEGYILECENYDEYFEEGDALQFNLILFGKNIVYLNQYLQAFYYLGQAGLGKEHAQFQVCRVTNTTGQTLVEGNNVYKERYTIAKVSDYVEYRLHSSQVQRALRNDMQPYDRLIFHTPLTLKFRGSFIEEFDADAIMTAVWRRIYILNCFEGKEEGKDYEKIDVREHLPAITGQRVRHDRMRRYSGTHHGRVDFHGISGFCDISGLDEISLPLLLAGELIHLGKNTSFGFGRISLSQTK